MCFYLFSKQLLILMLLYILSKLLITIINKEKYQFKTLHIKLTHCLQQKVIVLSSKSLSELLWKFILMEILITLNFFK